MPFKMESGAQTVPTSFLELNDACSPSCVPDFDMFLRDSEVPSPSNLLYSSNSFMDSPDYMLLSSLEESCLLVSNGPAPAKQSRVPESPILRETLAKPSAPLRDLQHRLVVQPPPAPTTLAVEEEEEDSVAMLQSLAAAVTQVLVKQEPFEVSTSSVSCQGYDCIGSLGNEGGQMKREEMTMVKQEQQGLAEDYCSGLMMDVDNIEEVQSLVMSQLATEVDNVCNQMGISADPMNWSCEDVFNWLMWIVRQYDLPMFRLDYFNMDGPTLCSLSVAQFRTRAAQSGEDLFALLELWKTACHRILEKTQASEPAPLLPPPPPPLQQSKPSFKLEDSLLDMTAYFQWPMVGSPDTTPPREGSVSPDGVAVVPDSSTGHGSDYSSDGGLQSDDDASEDGVEVERPVRHSSSHSHIHLWQFLKELLLHSQYSSCIRWLDRTKGVFKIEDSVRVARLWGKRKNRPAMNYDKLSRSIRQYYKKGIMKKTERSQRLVYQFCHPYCL